MGNAKPPQWAARILEAQVRPHLFKTVVHYTGLTASRVSTHEHPNGTLAQSPVTNDTSQSSPMTDDITQSY